MAKVEHQITTMTQDAIAMSLSLGLEREKTLKYRCVCQL